MGKTCFLFFVLLFLMYTTQAMSNEKFRVVNTAQGPVKGYKSSRGNFYGFYGIPYATTPTGRDKFKPPLPAPVWTETLEAVQQNKFCPQKLFLQNFETEENDCLMINVIVPDTDETNLPVMANIHGGGYQGGGGNMLTSDALVELGNVIVVNFNYRLGVHGFLCLGTEDIPGNGGMKDMVVALHWIKENIAKFGGNPDDVSLNGYSAGGSAVELLTLSKTTVGLYNKIIPESGSGLSPWSVQIDPLANAKRYASLLNFTNVDDILALEEFYKTITYEKLFSHAYLEERDTSFVFVPCVERDTGSEMFLKEAPEEIMKKGNFPKLPALIGFANMEGIARTLVFEVWKNEMNENFADFLPVDLQFESRNQKEEVANKIKNFYFGDRPVGDDTLEEYINLFSDIMFNFPAMRSIKYQIEAGNEKVYLYEYSYVDDAILEKSLYPHVRGASHGAQSYTLLDLPSGSFFNDTKSYLELKDIMKKISFN